MEVGAAQLCYGKPHLGEISAFGGISYVLCIIFASVRFAFWSLVAVMLTCLLY